MTENNRYKNGKIYTIRYRGDDSLIYVGSTCLPLHQRFYVHKNTCFNQNSKDYNIYLYQTIRKTGNINDWYIELYENYTCENKEQLLKREGEIIRELGTLNKVISGRTDKEYYIDNKDKILDQRKEYYGIKKEEIKQKKKEKYTDNKDKVLEQMKAYYITRKDELSKKVICDCGCEVSTSFLTTHRKSKKHINLMKEKEEK